MTRIESEPLVGRPTIARTSFRAESDQPEAIGAA